MRDDVGTDLTQTNLETVFNTTNLPKLNALLNNSFTSSYGFNNQRITGVATPTAGTDAANKNYVDGSIAGNTAVTSAVGPAAGNGYTLVWDQAGNRWVAQAPTGDSTKLPLAGGTMVGPISMSSYDLFAVGNIRMSAQRFLGLGTYNDAQEPATFGAADEGRVIYNTQSDFIKVWNGSAWQKIPYLNAGD